MTDIEFEELIIQLRGRKNWSDYSEQMLKRCWKGGNPIERLIDQPYCGKQMRELCVGLEAGVDIDQFADVEISAKKMQDIREKLPSVYRQTDVSSEESDVLPIQENNKPVLEERKVVITKTTARSKQSVVPSAMSDAIVSEPVIVSKNEDEELLASLSKSDDLPPIADQADSFLVAIDNPVRWNDIEIRESDLSGLTPIDFCRRAGVSGADSVLIDKEDFQSLKNAKAGITVSLSIQIRDRSFVILADVVDKESLNAAQLEQICRARDAGLPYQMLVGFEADQMHEIRMGLLTLDRSVVEMYAKQHFSSREMRYLRWAASLGYQSDGMSLLDASNFALKKLTERFSFFPHSVFRGVYDEEQIQLYISMWKEGFRDVIPSLARIHLTGEQLREVFSGLMVSRLALSYAHLEFSPEQMREMRYELMKRVGNKERFLRRIELSKMKKLQQQQLKELQAMQAK